MEVVVVLNFSRSGGTLLTRILGMLPDTIVASEINPLLGVSPDNKAVSPALALRRQMAEWYGILLQDDAFLAVMGKLGQKCCRSGKQLIIRDWSQLDFRRTKLNDWNPTYQFTIIDELEKIVDLTVFAFVRDAIDVYLSSRGDLRVFAEDYLTYVRELIHLGVPVIKYEDLVKNPDETVKRICDISGLKYSEVYRDFSTNYKCTGDIQLGNASRGFRQEMLTVLPRKWLGWASRRWIDNCNDLLEANRLLDYPIFYQNGNVETIIQMILRRSRSRHELVRK